MSSEWEGPAVSKSISGPEEFWEEVDKTAERMGMDRSEYTQEFLPLKNNTLEEQIERLEDEIEGLDEEIEDLQDELDAKKAMLEHKRKKLEEQREAEEVAEDDVEQAYRKVAAYLTTDVDVTVAAESSIETILKHDDSVGAVDEILERAEERVEEIDPSDYLPDRMVASHSEETSSAELL